MRRFSLVITDVDGTLVTHGKVLTPRAIAAVRGCTRPASAFRSAAAGRHSGCAC